MADTKGRRASTLRFIAVRLGVPELAEIAKKPGISEGFRLSVLYHDGRHPNQIATLVRARDNAVTLDIMYRRITERPAFTFTLTPDRFRVFDRTLRQLGFDRLDDQPDMPLGGVDLWLVERASGSFFHDVVLAPDAASGPYAELVSAVRAHLREAVRPIQPD